MDRTIIFRAIQLPFGSVVGDESADKVDEEEPVERCEDKAVLASITGQTRLSCPLRVDYYQWADHIPKLRLLHVSIY